MHLLIAGYPPFEKYYRKNKYFSTVKPQIIGLATQGDQIIAHGKFLWRDLPVGDATMRLCAFGVTVAKEHRQQGIATKLINLFLDKTREVGGDVLYSTTANSVLGEALVKTGFEALTVPIEYIDADTGEVVAQTTAAYAYALRPEIIGQIESLEKLNIGIGPI